MLKSHRHDTHEQADAAHRVAMLAAVCNTVTPEVKNGKIFYDGDSPDELALMESLRLNDITLVDRTNTTITLKGEMMEGCDEHIFFIVDSLYVLDLQWRGAVDDSLCPDLFVGPQAHERRGEPPGLERADAVHKGRGQRRP